MLFNSLPFFILVLITFVIYYLPLFSRYQISVLVVSSLIFYSYHQPILVLLLLFSCFINIITSYYIVYGDIRNKKQIAVAGVVLNLIALCFFKYSPLFAKTFLSSDNSIAEFLISIPLPIGISFFTFQGISLVIDVFKGKYFNNKEVIPLSFLEHSRRIIFFISFFPQLIAGPIVKAHDFIPQITIKKFSQIPWEDCFKNLVIGYFLKMVIADNLKEFTFWISYPYFMNFKTLPLLGLLFGYSCQIFADFAGYSLIAIGLAYLFGYQLLTNFNFPYIATSFKEFWKRWHISLSSFLMEYLYIPLGGNKKGKARTYFNLMLTMFLGGLWHGAAWSYAVWGIFHGLALAIERLLTDKIKVPKNVLTEILKASIVFTFVTFAWLLFKLPNFTDVIAFVNSVIKNEGRDSYVMLFYIFIYSLPVLLYHLHYLSKGWSLNYRKFEYIPYGVMLFLIATNSGPSGSFIYFQF